MQLRALDKQILSFGNAVLTAGIFVFFREAVKLLELDDKTEMLEALLLPLLTVSYFWGIRRYRVSIRNTFFFFFALLWLALIPVANFYACPTPDQDQFSYFLKDLPWYGTKTGQIAITALLGGLGCARCYCVCCCIAGLSKTWCGTPDRRKSFYAFPSAAISPDATRDDADILLNKTQSECSDMKVELVA